jgi:uncharacterized OB-fold protein
MTEFTMLSKDFYKALDHQKLIGSRCKKCGAYITPQRQICPNCHSDQTEVITFSGKGELSAYTVISVPPVKMAEAGYDGKNPYCVGIITLDEGPKVSAQILNVDLMHPENIKIGTKMVMTTIKRGQEDQEETFLAFQPE